MANSPGTRARLVLWQDRTNRKNILWYHCFEMYSALIHTNKRVKINSSHVTVVSSYNARTGHLLLHLFSSVPSANCGNWLCTSQWWQERDCSVVIPTHIWELYFVINCCNFLSTSTSSVFLQLRIWWQLVVWYLVVDLVVLFRDWEFLSLLVLSVTGLLEQSGHFFLVRWWYIVIN